MGGGGGDTLNSLFPGYRDKIWARLSPQIRQYLIRRDNAGFESSMHTLSVVQRQKYAAFFQYLADPLRPSYQYRKPVVDYKRQVTRGTYVQGRHLYKADGKGDRLDMSNPSNLWEPFTPQEQEQRRKNKALTFAVFFFVILSWPTFICHFARNDYFILCQAEGQHQHQQPEPEGEVEAEGDGEGEGEGDGSDERP
ncbi:unnamed protein product [Vitrella brassicaformis CCMP3155]|uniref:Uncharacterized protein n=1 Tax=Vitrella brassicaformis (strain CCMP3155) TaxID=1169540 RepID=A0A0G4EA23_VITBC|nr:unnamed protein product [Vitrella brassicaformis CCMP3155]|mmetsp:Transcript_17330/g.49189  ORF Transcript_17330/g.49189 Transcript_17330/m.49189 type:complete len:195 (+) Transcript_17330:63-647(+)|eukprot:CEL92080.1 unnamed protein product [Vitrella brassicaformis CCMP3155]